MGLQETIRSAVATAKSAVTDLLVAVDYQRRNPALDYDPTAGTVANEPIVSSLSVLFAEFNVIERQSSQYQVGDRWAIVLEALDFAPKTGESFVEVIATTKWRVVDVAQPDVNVTKLHVRRVV